VLFFSYDGNWRIARPCNGRPYTWRHRLIAQAGRFQFQGSNGGSRPISTSVGNCAQRINDIAKQLDNVPVL
jgi:hypothetical protein